MANATENQELGTVELGSSNFFSAFHKTISHLTEGNIISSPLSAHIVLSYLFHGSGTHTAEEMKAGLSLTNEDQLHITYKNLIASLKNTSKVELDIVNSMFLNKDIELRESFRSIGTEFYNFEVEKVDFKDKVGAAKMINDWVSEKTREKIRNIISTEDIAEDMKLALVNAIYFKGQWLRQFNPENTQNREFHTTEKSHKQVPTMQKVDKYLSGEIPSLRAKFLEIPYMENNLGLIIILPNEIEGLKFIEENFDWDAVTRAEGHTSKINLHLPKFKTEATLDLKTVLRKMGCQSMFEDTADFSPMSDVPLKVDSVIQKAFLEVSEYGSEAAAATMVRMILKRSLSLHEPQDFIVDRPFLVAIRHSIFNIPLFISSVRDVNAAPEKDEL